MLSAASRGEGRHEHRGDDGEVFGDVVGDRERGQRAAGHQQLFADLDDLDELGRVAVEVDHVAGLARGLRAGVHGDADIGLGQRGRVVGAVAGHGDELALGLFVADALELVLGRRLGQEIVDPGFGGDGGGGHRIVAGDHDGADAHAAQLGEAFLDAALDDVLELRRRRAGGRRRPRAACRRPWRSRPRSPDLARHVGIAVDRSSEPCFPTPPRGFRRRYRCRIASTAPLRTDDAPASTPLMRVWAVNGMKVAASSRHVAAADAEFLLGQHDDRAALGGLVGQ